jgi:hypothetical protein
MTARALLNSGSKWTDTTTRIAMPIVLRRAMDGESIFYSELNDAAHTAGASSALDLNYRSVAGKIGDICQVLSKELSELIPPLNAIIVNKESKLPSHDIDSYLATFFELTKRQINELSAEKRDHFARAAMEKVFDYSGWRTVRELLRFPESRSNLRAVRCGTPIPLPDPKAFSYGPESEAHKKLKLWVAANPRIFGSFGNFTLAGIEHGLTSGDRLDVCFECTDAQLAVEVKARDASESEVRRGVFQCVKYRATLRAMQLVLSHPPNAQAVLVIERDPTETTVKLADRLSVAIMNVRGQFK